MTEDEQTQEIPPTEPNQGAPGDAPKPAPERTEEPGHDHEAEERAYEEEVGGG